MTERRAVPTALAERVAGHLLHDIAEGVHAATLAARRRTAEDLRRMEEALTLAGAAFEADDVDAFSEADLAFHQAVLDAVENHFVPALLVPVDGSVAGDTPPDQP